MPSGPNAPTDPWGDPSAGVRPALRALRRRRRRGLIAGITGAVVAIAGFGVGAALAVSNSVDEGPDVPQLVKGDPVTTTTTTTSGEVPVAECRSPLTGEEPLRLWIGGDSLAGSLGPSLGELTAATGVVQPVFDSRVSSGLSSPSFFDWPKHAKAEMTRLDPEIVVFIIGANDFTTPRTSSSEWKTEYANAVEEMLSIFESNGRRVYWIGAPPMQDNRKDLGVRGVNEVMQSVVARHHDVTYVDAYTLFAGPDGQYTASLTGSDGRRVRVRAGDGIHFTPEGGDLLAAELFKTLDTQCNLQGQAIPGSPKRVIETEGSSQIPGTRRTTASSTPSTATTTQVTQAPSTTTIVVTPTTGTTTTTPKVPQGPPIKL